MFKVSNRDSCLIPLSTFDCIFIFLPLLILPFILSQKVNYYIPSLIHTFRLSSFLTGLMSSLETSAPLIILSKVVFFFFFRSRHFQHPTAEPHLHFHQLLHHFTCHCYSAFGVFPSALLYFLSSPFYRKTHTFCCQERHTHIIDRSIFQDVMYNSRLSECVINGCQTLT